MKTKLSLSAIQLVVLLLVIIIPPAADAAIRIMPLGDSITRGVASGAVPDESAYYIAYRKALHDLLVLSGYGVDFIGSLDDGSAVFVDSQHEGHGGYKADQIRDEVLSYLSLNPPNVILLHIGTNDISQRTPDVIVAEVSQILDNIDQYESDNDVKITVILALIINRLDYICSDPSVTSTYNDLLYNMALARISLGDRIEIVDMECGANIDYAQEPDGDMYELVHPFHTGYEKMAHLWFAGFQAIQPEADAGLYQDMLSSDLVTLDGSSSSDHFGAALSYQWTQTQGPAVVLSDSQSANPTFTAPYVGASGETLTFRLTVTDPAGLQATATTSVNVVYPGQPVADAGPDQIVNGSQLVILDGSGSHDPDQDPLIYFWNQAASDTIQVTLSDPTAVNPKFTSPSGLSQDTALNFNLVVNDGHVDSPIDSVVITVKESAPIADAGEDQTVNPNQLVTLDGSGSHDPDQDPLTYLWHQELSDPIQATLSDPTAVNPSFTAPSGLSQNTALNFNLVVNDGHIDSAIDSVVITVTASNPIPSSSNSQGGGGCFIATAAYGSILEPHVKILREFRDRFLLDNPIGKGFIILYYKYSPPIAHFISKHAICRALVRICLLPIVGISWVALKLGLLPAIALLLFCIFGFIGTSIIRRKKTVIKMEQ